jgi:hypothetical protein
MGYPNKNVQGDALFARIGFFFGCGAARCHLEASDSQFTARMFANTFCAINGMPFSFCASKRLIGSNFAPLRAQTSMSFLRGYLVRWKISYVQQHWPYCVRFM